MLAFNGVRATHWRQNGPNCRINEHAPSDIPDRGIWRFGQRVAVGSATARKPGASRRAAAASALTSTFIEAVIAPSIDDAARAVLAAKPNMRVVTADLGRAFEPLQGANARDLRSFLGGALTQAFSWPWVFFVNVPVGIVTFALAPMRSRTAAVMASRAWSSLDRVDIAILAMNARRIVSSISAQGC